MRHPRALSIMAPAALSLVVGVPMASAYPVSRGAHYTPHVQTAEGGPPTTADCVANFGIACYSPNQMQQAYNVKGLHASGLTGKGRTIVIVDSFGSPTIEADLKKFDADFGLPDPPSIKTITPAGPLPPFDPDNADMKGWAFETTLDVQYAHGMAPGANIVIAATPVSETEGETGFPEIVKAENYVIDHNIGDVITQSFGASEDTFTSKASLLSLRSAFKNATLHGVPVLGSSGDSGSTDYQLDGETLYQQQENSWPSADPLVTSIGGTQLHLDADGNRTSPDTVWNDIPVGIDGASGGGPSHVFPRPIWQYLVNTKSGQARATPDVSMSAAVDGGALVYTSYPGDPEGYGIVGGTSEASPLFSGIVALASQAAGRKIGALNPRLYAQNLRRNSGFVDVTQGTNTFTALDDNDQPLFTVPGYDARPGYDMATGLGTIDGPNFVRALAGR